MPDVLVVIPCLNEEKHIEALVRQLAADPSLHIVVADGGSSDATVPAIHRLEAEFPRVSYLYNTKKLQSAAINLAVGQFGAGKDYFIRIDAHAEYPGDYCRKLIEDAQATQADSVTVTMDTRGKTPFQKAVAAAQNFRLGNGGSAHRAPTAHGRWVDHGHHALMRIAAFRQVGGYDENFSHNEDAELDMRLTRAGFKIWLTGKTGLIYYPRATPYALFKQYYNYGAGRIRNILKHKTRPRLRQLAPAVVMPAFLLALGAPFKCWLLALPLLAWATACLSYGLLLALKLGEKTVMLSGPAAMIMHAGWSFGFWRGLVRLLEGKK